MTRQYEEVRRGAYSICWTMRLHEIESGETIATIYLPVSWAADEESKHGIGLNSDMKVFVDHANKRDVERIEFKISEINWNDDFETPSHHAYYTRNPDGVAQIVYTCDLQIYTDVRHPYAANKKGGVGLSFELNATGEATFYHATRQFGDIGIEFSYPRRVVAVEHVE